MVTAGSIGQTRVAIIGGGPAGLAAAIAARQRGFSVVVLDSRQPPIDKPCGEGLMPDGLEALSRLGIDLSPAVGYPFRGIRFTDGSSSVAADFPHGQAIGIRRTVLHSLLCARARDIGVELRWGTPVTAIRKGQVQTGSESLRCCWIVGADGHTSAVRRWAGLDTCAREKHRYTFRTHYAVAPWSSHMELHWAPSCQVYITPVSSAEVCVVAMSNDRTLRMADALRQLPHVEQLFAAAAASSIERGAVTCTRQLKRICTSDIALVGDASGSVDAITGEGLCLCFRQAVALAEALERRRLEHYEAAHRALARRPTFMAGFMLLLANRSRLRRRAVHALSRKPRIFETMLAMHVGAASIPIFASSAIELGWQMFLD